MTLAEDIANAYYRAAMRREHQEKCEAAIASIGGDPATVGELVAALRACFRMIIYRSDGGLYHDEQLAFDKASAVLDKLPNDRKHG